VPGAELAIPLAERRPHATKDDRFTRGSAAIAVCHRPLLPLASTALLR